MNLIKPLCLAAEEMLYIFVAMLNEMKRTDNLGSDINNILLQTTNEPCNVFIMQ